MDLPVVAGGGEHQARSRRHAVDEHGAGAAHAVLAAEMRRRQIVPLAQQVGERQARRDILAEIGTIEAIADHSHYWVSVACVSARNAAVACRLWRNSSSCRSATRARSAAIASRAAAASTRPRAESRDVASRISGGPSA